MTETITNEPLLHTTAQGKIHDQREICDDEEAVSTIVFYFRQQLEERFALRFGTELPVDAQELIVNRHANEILQVFTELQTPYVLDDVLKDAKAKLEKVLARYFPVHSETDNLAVAS